MKTARMCPPFLINEYYTYLVKNNEEKIKTGEKRVLHSNVVHWVFVFIILKGNEIRENSTSI